MRDDITRMARQAGFNVEQGYLLRITGIDEDLERFDALVAAAEREKVAAWMMQRSYATGHGDTIEDLLKELEWQVAEREREACAKVCEGEICNCCWTDEAQAAAEHIAAAIRARGGNT